MIHSSCAQIELHQDQRILTIQLNRPERKNALSLAMYSALADVIHQANQSPEIRVLVLKGQDEFFTSGNDLMDFMNDPEIREDHPVVRFINALMRSEKPVVAVVKGFAIGIGTTLLLHCDLVYVADDAKLQLPFVNLGLCPEYASSYLLPRLIGKAKASELLLLGESFSGAKAAELGIATASAPWDELNEYAQEKINRLANQPPGAVKRTKALLSQSQRLAIDECLQAEYKAFAEGLGSEECKESVTAFFEKRAPDFSRF
jgi:enoyl-CoA hydratase/carnithine racemase